MYYLNAAPGTEKEKNWNKSKVTVQLTTDTLSLTRQLLLRPQKNTGYESVYMGKKGTSATFWWIKTPPPNTHNVTCANSPISRKREL